MNGLWSRIAWAGIAVAALAASGEGREREETAATPASTGRTLEATGGRCVGLDQREAYQEADAKARQNLLEEVGKLAEELSQPARRQLVAEHAWLLAQPGVEQKTEEKVEERGYASVAEKSIRMTIPDHVLADWAARLAEQRRRRTWLLASGAGATLAGWLGALALLIRLDRLTGGYRRALLVPVIVATTLAATGLGWTLLLHWIPTLPTGLGLAVNG
ncbi:MAG: hypothetical protein ACUVQQ_01840 [Thermogutta sp.]